jgi:hypothetical protein
MTNSIPVRIEINRPTNCTVLVKSEVPYWYFLFLPVLRFAIDYISIFATGIRWQQAGKVV